MLELIRPSVEYKASFIEAVREFKRDGHHRYIDKDIAALQQDFESFIEDEWGEKQNPSWVPQTVYWLVDEKGFIGRIALRHYLNESLRQFGGHIGYEVRPSRRREGHGTHMLKLLLELVRRIHKLDRVLLTCDQNNIGSQKIIKANGGVLEDVITLDFRPEPTMRWWIILSDT